LSLGFLVSIIGWGDKENPRMISRPSGRLFSFLTIDLKRTVMGYLA
jgi:hypothetical protein